MLCLHRVKALSAEVAGDIETPPGTCRHAVVVMRRHQTQGPRCATEAPMTTSDNAPVAVFTPGEREYIRRELDQFFSFFPSVAGGFALRTWRGGPQKAAKAAAGSQEPD